MSMKTLGEALLIRQRDQPMMPSAGVVIRPSLGTERGSDSYGSVYSRGGAARALRRVRPHYGKDEK